MRIHTGENPFKCRICPMAVTRSDYLSRHLQTHKSIPGPSGIIKEEENEDSTIADDFYLAEEVKLYEEDLEDVDKHYEEKELNEKNESGVLTIKEENEDLLVKDDNADFSEKHN